MGLFRNACTDGVEGIGEARLMETIIVAAGAFIAAALTVPAGFGLSTMLTPFVLAFMPPHEAIAVVAVVHGAHNAAKCWSMWEWIDFSAFKRYGVWLIFGAIAGAGLQNQVSQDPLLVVVGVFLVILPLLTLSERWTGYRIPEANDRMGGFGSGFMGGLSGHQGALRAMFLTRRLPDKMAYAATASILALCVDLSRVPVYLVFRSDDLMAHVQICSILVISAVLGARMGKKWLESLKSDLIHRGVMAGIMASGFYYIYEGLA